MENSICFFKKPSLLVIGICLLLCSCNNSFTALNRKYRPGLSFSSSKSKIKTGKKSDLCKNEIKTDSIFDENKDETATCSIKKEPLIINYKPKPITIVCDTPPKKKGEEWSLYKPKEPKSQHPRTKEKRNEPISIIVLLATIIIIAIGGIVGYWALIIPLILFILSIISLVRIKKNPEKFKKFSKILGIILLILYSLFVLGLIIAGIIILSSM